MTSHDRVVERVLRARAPFSSARFVSREPSVRTGLRCSRSSWRRSSSPQVGPEPLQDALTSQFEGACAETQQAGDVVWRGVLQEHRDDRPIAILDLIQQRVDRAPLKVGELLLPRGGAPDDSDLLLGIRIAAKDTIGAGNS